MGPTWFFESFLLCSCYFSLVFSFLSGYTLKAVRWGVTGFKLHVTICNEMVVKHDSLYRFKIGRVEFLQEMARLSILQTKTKSTWNSQIHGRTSWRARSVKRLSKPLGSVTIYWAFGLIVRVECHLISKSKFPRPRGAMIEISDACAVPQIAGSIL